MNHILRILTIATSLVLFVQIIKPMATTITKPIKPNITAPTYRGGADIGFNLVARDSKCGVIKFKSINTPITLVSTLIWEPTGPYPISRGGMSIIGQKVLKKGDEFIAKYDSAVPNGYYRINVASEKGLYSGPNGMFQAYRPADYITIELLSDDGVCNRRLGTFEGLNMNQASKK